MTALELCSGLGRAEPAPRGCAQESGNSGNTVNFAARVTTRISQAAPHRFFEASASVRSDSSRWH